MRIASEVRTMLRKASSCEALELDHPAIQGQHSHAVLGREKTRLTINDSPMAIPQASAS
jgi:hypothetical protein